MLDHHEEHLTYIDDEVEDGTDATNNQRGYSSPLPATSERAVPTADFAPTNPLGTTHQVTRIMKDIRECKLVAVDVILSTIRKRDCYSFQNDLVDNGLISVLLGLLKLCKHTDYNDVVEKVKGNIRTPADWIEILTCFGNHDQCRLDIANRIQAVVWS